MESNKIRIKTEPGTSTATLASQRLPSLRPPRDLSLSAFGQGRLPPNLVQSKNKKVYIPNLNVQRKKPADDIPVKQEHVKKEKGRGGPEERGRGRGRKFNFVQMSSGVFADGLASGMKNSRSSGSGGGSGSGEKKDNTLQMPKLKLEDDIKVNKEEEENTVKELLRDDFIDDPTLEPDFDNCPVKLPLEDWKVFNVDQEEKPIIKQEEGEIKVKQEPGLKEEKPQPGLKEVKPHCRSKLTIADIINSSRSEPQFIFVQLPSCMPGLKPEVETPRSTTKSTTETPSVNTPTTEHAEAMTSDRCLLSTLPPGLIGRLQILKSGRCRLQLGDTKMWLHLGTQVAFKQDLISVDLNTSSKTGNMITLGPVSTRMTVSLDWESMLATKTAV